MLRNLFVLFVIFLLAQSCTKRCKKRCEEGWTPWNRTMGVWCHKVVPMSSGTVYKAEAVPICEAIGAVLSSLESFLEFVTVSNLLTAQNLQTAFLGAENSPNCSCPYSDTVFSCESTAECDLSTAYVWTDNFTVGKAAMGYIGTPFDSNWRQTLKVVGGEGIHVGGIVYRMNIVTWTDGEKWNGNYTSGVVCGKPAA